MIQKLKMVLLSFSTLFALAIPMAVTAGTAEADLGIPGSVCSGTNGDFTGGGNTGCTDTEANSKANSLIKTVVNILSIVVGVIAVIMIIIGGFRYITSGGKQESITGAKNTILYALIGLVIVALAQIIVHFVLGKANSSSSG